MDCIRSFCGCVVIILACFAVGYGIASPLTPGWLKTILIVLTLASIIKALGGAKK